MSIKAKIFQKSRYANASIFVALGSIVGAIASGYGLANGSILILAALGLFMVVIAAFVNLTLPTVLWMVVAPLVQSGLEPGSPSIWLAYAFHRVLLPTLAIIAIVQYALRKVNKFALLEKLFMLFLAYALVSNIVTWGFNWGSEQTRDAWRALLFNYFVPFSAFLLANRLSLADHHEKMKAKTLLAGLSIMSIAISGISLFEYITNIKIFPGTIHWQEAWGERAAGPLGNPVINAYVAQVGMCAAIYLGIQLRGITYKVLGIMAMLLTGFYALLTYTRSAWVSFLVALTVIVLSHRRARRWVFAALTALLILFVVNAGGLVNLDFLQERTLNKDNVWGRLAISHTAIQMFLEQPLFGQGFGSYDQRVYDFATSVFGMPTEVSLITSHNTMLTILAELGLLGFSLCVAAIVIALLPGLRALLTKRYEKTVDRPLLLSLLGGIAAYMANAMVIDMRFFSFAQSLFWFNLGLFYSLGVTAFKEKELESNVSAKASIKH